jgi:hypothetical protein
LCKPLEEPDAVSAVCPEFLRCPIRVNCSCPAVVLAVADRRIQPASSVFGGVGGISRYNCIRRAVSGGWIGVKYPAASSSIHNRVFVSFCSSDLCLCPYYLNSMCTVSTSPKRVYPWLNCSPSYFRLVDVRGKGISLLIVGTATIDIR